MKKFVLPVLLLASVSLAACTHTASPASDSSDGAPGIEDKQGDTTKNGTLVKQGEKYYIKAETGEMEEVESYSVDFSEFENQRVSATGQYSGDTLFIGKMDLAVE